MRAVTGDEAHVSSDPAPPSTADAAPGGTPPTGPPKRRGPTLALAGGVVAALLLGIGLLAFVRPNGGATQGTTTIDASTPPPGIGRSGVSLLGLSVFASSSDRPSDFTLTDQHGTPVSLSSLKGEVVVLSFNDDRCPDLCTLLAQSIVIADRDLGPAARHVVFLSVNVNPFYPQVRYVRQWADQHHLGATANWVSTTGPVPKLRAIWHRYGIYVGLDHKTRTVVHSTELFFIDPTGLERAIGAFGVPAANTTLYAHDLAQMADDLLPASEQVDVGGPTTPAPTGSNATVGAPAPSFHLPLLGQAHGALSSASLTGRYAVLDFFSGSSPAVRRQLENVERAHRELGGKVAFVGVDTTHPATSGLAVARRAGVDFPVVDDAAGRLSHAYRIAGPQPFAVVLGPRGTILVRHPGALTTEQLTYVLHSEMSGGP